MNNADAKSRGPLNLFSLVSGQPGPETPRDLLREVIDPGVSRADVRIAWEPPRDPDEMTSESARDQLGWNR